MVLGRRDHDGVAVDGAAARREDHAPRPRVDRGTKDIHGADHVDVGVVERIAHQLANVDLGSVVEDDLGLRVGNGGRERVGDVMSSSTNVARRVDLRAPAAREVVDDGDRVTGVDERVGDVRADEAGPAGDQRPHPWVTIRCALGTWTWVSTKITKPITTRLA